MTIELIERGENTVALVQSGTPLICDGPSALELAVNAGAQCIAVNKAAVSEDFFDLSTGVAGDAVQKLVNYRYRLAIVGDFSQYSSKALRDYMYECNNGRHLYFVPTTEQALEAFDD